MRGGTEMCAAHRQSKHIDERPLDRMQASINRRKELFGLHTHRALATNTINVLSNRERGSNEIYYRSREIAGAERFG